MFFRLDLCTMGHSPKTWLKSHGLLTESISIMLIAKIIQRHINYRFYPIFYFLRVFFIQKFKKFFSRYSIYQIKKFIIKRLHPLNLEKSEKSVLKLKISQISQISLKKTFFYFPE